MMIIEFTDDFDNYFLVDIDGTLNCATSFEMGEISTSTSDIWIITIDTEHVCYEIQFKTRERQLEIYNKIKELVEWESVDDFKKMAF